MDKQEFYVFHNKNLPLYIYRKGIWNEETKEYDFDSFKEYFTELECEFDFNKLIFHKGAVVFYTNKFGEEAPDELGYEELTDKEFMNAIYPKIEATNEIASEINSLFDSMMDENLSKKCEQFKVEKSKPKYQKKSNKKRRII